MLRDLSPVVQLLTWAALLFALAGMVVSGVMLALGQRRPRPVPLSSSPAAGAGRRSGR